MEAGCEEDCLSALSEACPRGKKDSELYAGGLAFSALKEMLKTCCVWSAGLNATHTWNTRGTLRKQEGGCLAICERIQKCERVLKQVGPWSVQPETVLGHLVFILGI